MLLKLKNNAPDFFSVHRATPLEGYNIFCRDDQISCACILLGGVGALRLSCVPLNVTQSLSALRETLGQSHYTARALRHTHKLLMLYLAGQMNGNSAPRFTLIEFKLYYTHIT